MNTENHLEWWLSAPRNREQETEINDHRSDCCFFLKEIFHEPVESEVKPLAHTDINI